MEIIGWMLVAVLGAAVVVLLVRKPENPYAGAIDRLTREMERGGEVSAEAAGDPPEVAALRRLVAESWSPGSADEEDPGDRALRGLVRYLRGAALDPLQVVLRNGGAQAGEAVREVVDALEDLEFYAEPPPEETSSRQNLPNLIQEVTREYTRETGISVKLRFSSPTIQGDVPPTAFKDALFLLLSNAGRFGSGQTVVVEAEGGGAGTAATVRVLDRGGGFTEAALEHAFEPFWSTDRDAAGLGLTYARRILRPRGVRLRIANREEGGGVAEIAIP